MGGAHYSTSKLLSIAKTYRLTASWVDLIGYLVTVLTRTFSSVLEESGTDPFYPRERRLQLLYRT